MEWNEYVSHLLQSDSDFDKLTFSLNGGETSINIPPIIKTSILILDKMISHQGNNNILVFPEKTQTFFIFTLMELFYNISQGKIKSIYDPSGFTIGEKLKVGNAIAEYRGLEERNGKTCLILKLADLTKYSAPLSYLPVFQKTSTNRSLSRNDTFIDSLNKKKKEMGLKDNEDITHIVEMKTHLDSSIIAVTSVASAQEQLRDCRISGKRVTDTFFIGKANYEGKITNIGPGQLNGIPAIVITSDLYSATAAAEKTSVQSIIIDASNTNTLLNQLDALDELIRLNVPIVCITDTANSFEMDQLVKRRFNIWRWNEQSLTDELYDTSDLFSDKRIKNCAKHSVQYLESDGNQITEAIKRLMVHRKETETSSPQIMKLYEKLTDLTFNALRAIIPLSDIERNLAFQKLEDCTQILKGESRFLPEETCKDYYTVIESLKDVYAPSYIFQKIEKLKNYLKNNPSENLFLIIPERSPKGPIQQFWDNWCIENRITAMVTAMHPADYYAGITQKTGVTIITGWLKRAIMRKVIYSFSTSQYIVLLYDYETRWQSHDVSRWTKALNIHKNKSIIEKSLASRDIKISTTRFDNPPPPPVMKIPDELGEIEVVIRENKYKQYVNGSSHSQNEIVSVIPVNFVGGHLAFYQTSHKIVVATKVITEDSGNIEIKLPSNLQIGDFIVVRTTDRDLIRELADIILKNDGHEDTRDVVKIWRDVIEIELLFCEKNEFIKKLRDAGCSRSPATIKNWIDDPDKIAPSSIEDLRILAEVSENETLLEKLDEVYDAAQIVRKAHQQAGKNLSDQLRLTIAEELKKHENIDPYNIWEPVDIEIDGIGNVKVLKIIDIGSEIQVDKASTNQLIAE